jgi:hypothetical protein
MAFAFLSVLPAVKAGGLLPDLFLSDIPPIVNAYVTDHVSTAGRR